MSPTHRGEGFVMEEAPEQGAPEGPISFTTFVLGLASTALVHLGETPHPETGQPHVDLPLARQTLDLLSLLKDKTRGNLTRDEDRVFTELLTDLRLRYVRVTGGGPR